ncbi:MAG: SUMF1/EgtB/PvdO family nonheme iron enzyme [Bacteroidales bacterium]
MKFPAFSSFILMFLFLSFIARSNNIQVQNVSLEDQVAAEHYVFIEFDLSWDNSWRTTSVPDNWDAAWIFCKYRLAGGEWQHVYLHFEGHTAPAGATIQVAGDTTGAFIYRGANGSGTNAWDNIRLRWDYGYQGVNDDATLEVKVFAIEMVYVTEGAFYLGDSTSSGRFYTYDNDKSFFHVTSENAIPTGTMIDYLWAASNISSGTITAPYPKGYGAFYVMKYELSQEQYIEFLNCLTRVQQNTRTYVDISGTSVTNYFVLTNQNHVNSRNGIRCDQTIPASGPVEIYADFNHNGVANESGDGQNIACNWISWPDLAAYLDWSGLRPMTDLEFEKACRGPNHPVGGEYAWGNALIHDAPYTLVNSGSPDEMIVSMPQNTGNGLYVSTRPSGDDVLRCGIFAASSVNHTRMESGATYYGIMEMSGNTWEICVNAYHNAGRSFTGLHGNGNLLPSGDADVDYWPGINNNSDESTANTIYQTAGVTGRGGVGSRGQNLFFSLSSLPVSSRGDLISGTYTSRNSNFGGRGVRTAE